MVDQCQNSAGVLARAALLYKGGGFPRLPQIKLVKGVGLSGSLRNVVLYKGDGFAGLPKFVVFR